MFCPPPPFALARRVVKTMLAATAQTPTGEDGTAAVDSGPIPLEAEEEDESTRRMPL
ncbi:hypothetical protein [Roseateles sp. L2-2]|uniref:hypothetical protein n=1 Tax=Roseateles sp. L2-2 TaxID=3422597 RepID=UPI003D36EC48